MSALVLGLRRGSQKALSLTRIITTAAVQEAPPPAEQAAAAAKGTTPGPLTRDFQVYRYDLDAQYRSERPQTFGMHVCRACQSSLHGLIV